MYDFHVRRVDRWSHVDQGTVGEAIWALRSLEAIGDAYTAWVDDPTEQSSQALDDLLDALIEENKT